jgi:uncharacterized membrane protein YqjE
LGETFLQKSFPQNFFVKLNALLKAVAFGVAAIVWGWCAATYRYIRERAVVCVVVVLATIHAAFDVCHSEDSFQLM